MLREICLELLSSFEMRFCIPGLFTAASNAFNPEKCNWYDSEKNQDETIHAVLRNVMNEVKGTKKKFFEECYLNLYFGYKLFLSHIESEVKKAERQNKEVPNLEKLYHSFFTQF